MIVILGVSKFTAKYQIRHNRLSEQLERNALNFSYSKQYIDLIKYFSLESAELHRINKSGPNAVKAERFGEFRFLSLLEKADFLE